MLNGTDNNKKEINGLIERTIRKYADTIYRVAYQYLGNFSDAQDILQDVGISLVTGNPPFYDEEHLRNWILRVTINKCKNLYKHRKIHTCEELHENLQYEDPQYLGLMEELKKLPVKYKTVLYLYYYEEYSIEEISKILNSNSNTIGSQLRRGREKLKKILTEGE